MKKIVKDAVLTYEVTGSASAAEQKLYSGMKKEHIPLYIEDRDCSFRESQSQFSVECIWIAPITLDIPQGCHWICPKSTLCIVRSTAMALLTNGDVIL